MNADVVKFYQKNDTTHNLYFQVFDATDGNLCSTVECLVLQIF